MNSQPLQNIAQIIAGYTFRTTLPHQQNGDFLVVQAKNILSDGTVDELGLVPIANDNYRTTAFVQKWDVLISVRGNLRAGILHSGHQHVLAASSVNIIRCQSKEVLPDYLAIYLNSEPVQKILAQKVVGSSVSSILKKDLAELPIKIPDLNTQQKIIQLEHGKRDLEKLLSRKIQLLSNITDHVINKTLI